MKPLSLDKEELIMVTVIKKGSNKKIIAERIKALSRKPKKAFNAQQFCGILPLEEDALAIQKRLRDEWE